MAKAKKKSRVKANKNWYRVIAPRMFNEQSVGEILALEPSDTMGKTIPVNLTSLTRDMRQRNTTVVFEINNVSGSKLYSEMVGYELSFSSIKRMVKRGKEKVDHVFTAETSDGYKLRLKIIMVTLNDTKLSSLTRLRNTTEKKIKKMLKKMKYETFLGKLVHHKIQSSMKKKLNTVYPLRAFEVRKMEVLKKGKSNSK